MIENYLGYMEICMQLYANQNENPDIFECLQKYEDMLYNEYENMSEKDKETLKEIIISKIMNLKMEKGTILIAQSIMLRDHKLKDVFPGHIKAQYSDKLKKYQKEIKFLESISSSMNNSKEMKK